MNMNESLWYNKFETIFFLKDADGKILRDDWRWQAVLHSARISIRSKQLSLPAELIARNRGGNEALIARWDDLDGKIEEWIAENFQ